MKTIRELEQKIEKAIIETLSSYRTIECVLEDTDLTPEEKIKHALGHIKRFRIGIQNEFELIGDGRPVDKLIFGYDYESIENLEELKMLILHKIMNSTTSSNLINPDDLSIFDDITV